MITERVDDIPLIVAKLEKSQLSDYINQYFPDHGNWSGLDGGKVAVGFLTYVLSCGDHRLSRVEDWVAERLHTLQHCLSHPELSAKDFTDDRLGALLDKLSYEEQWDKFESAHNKNLIDVYNLAPQQEAIRLDAVNVQSFREEGEHFKLGYSKQHRADLPQLKVMVATMDPLSMPLSSAIVSGNTADDGLYLKVVKKLEQGIGSKRQLFVGDTKMGSIENRAYLHKQEQYYLHPLSKVQCSADQLADYLESQPDELVQIFADEKDRAQPPVLKAKAFEIQQECYCKNLDLHWTERRVIAYSTSYGEQQNRKLEERMAKAKENLDKLLKAKQGKKKLKTKAAVQRAVEQLLKNHKVHAFIEVEVKEQLLSIPVRKYGKRSAGFKETRSFSLEIQTNNEVLEKHRQNLGWRVYATNAPFEYLSTSQALICYRQEYRIEHKFNELLNKITALMPVYLNNDNRIEALIRLLLLALKFVSLIQFEVRQELKITEQQIKELYPGNPGRATEQPTTKMILEAFKNITLVVISVQNQTIIKISELKPIQLQLLKLLKLSPSVYTDLEQISFSGSHLGEI